MEREKNIFCPRNISPGGRILEAYLLCLLMKEGKDHGYGLITKLSNLGFDETNINIGTLYRSLRKLEKQGLVESSWKESEQGPNKRVYSITDTGKRELENLIKFLEKRKQIINTVLNHYKKLFPEGIGGGQNAE